MLSPIIRYACAINLINRYFIAVRDYIYNVYKL